MVGKTPAHLRSRTSTTRATQARIKVEEKRRRALDLRLAGATYDEIAQAIGYADRGNAWRAVEACLTSARKEKADQVMELELLRLDQMMKGLYVDARRGDTKAVLTILKIMDRRAKYLNLDSPVLTDAVNDGMNLLSGLSGQLLSAPDTYAPEPRAIRVKHTDSTFIKDDDVSTGE